MAGLRAAGSSGEVPEGGGASLGGLWSALLLVAAAILAFHNCLDGIFFFDDVFVVEGNEAVRALWPLSRYLEAPPETPMVGRPLAHLTLGLNWALGGLDPSGYHLANALIHLAAALVLFALLRRALRLPSLASAFGAGATPLALACAAIWLVHPLQTECINYVSQRTESLMGLFFFATFYCALRAARGERALAWSLAATVACLLGALSKGVIVSCPLLVVLFDRCFLYASLREAMRRRWPLYLGLAASWVLVFVLMSAYPRPATVGLHLYVSDWKVGAWGWALNQCEMITTYLKLAFWPSPLNADYGMPRPLTLGQVGWQAGLLLALLFATPLLLWRRKAVGFLAACWFVVLAPTSSVIPITSEVGAERRVYVPLAALVVLVVLLVQRLGARLLPDPRRARLAGGLLALFVVLLLASLSARRNRDYHSKVSIWGSVIEAAGDNGRAQLNYAGALHEAGRGSEAIAHYEQALRLRTSPLPPDQRAGALFNLGTLHEEDGRPEEALRCYREAARLWPGLTRAVYRTGTALKALGRIEPAMHSFRLFLSREPGHPEGLLQLALCQEIQGDLAGAIETCEQLVRLPGAPAQAHELLQRLRQREQ